MIDLSLLAQQTPVEAIDTPNVDWAILAPLLVMAVGGILMLTFASMLARMSSRVWSIAATVISLATAITVIPLWMRVTDTENSATSTLAGSVAFDGFSLFLTVVIALAVALTALLADGYLKREGLEGPELYVLLMMSASGGIIMAFANDLIVLFIGLEILSIAVYILAAMHTRKLQSQEAGMKYFVLGAFSSAFFLYGIALTYGATGSTNLITIKNFLATNALADDALLLAGFALMLVGLAFKVAAVPFHFWTPDVYQGAPSPVVGFMASAVKAAGFAGIIRVFVLTFEQYRTDWQPAIYVLAILSLVIGSFLAIVQTNVKRMLAYSSISHAGFILLGVQAATDRGVSAVLFYLATYTFMVIGSFGVLTLAGGTGDTAHTLDDYRGLSKRSPMLAFAFMIFLFSQAGVPFTTGFFSKFAVISAAIDARSFWLAVVAMITAVVSGFLYLRVIVSMFFSSDDDDHDTDDAADEDDATDAADGGGTHEPIDIPVGAGIAIAVCVLVTVVFGVWPGPIDDLAREAVPRLVAESAALFEVGN